MKKKKNIFISSFEIFLIRVLWNICYYVFFRFSPLYFSSYRRVILRLFGAKIETWVRIYPSVKIWIPSNLQIKRGTVIGPNVTLYNQGKILIGNNVIVSQNAHLCSGTHDYRHKNPELPHYTYEIEIKNNSWICADAFIGPGVTVEKGTVVGARAVVFKNTVMNGVYIGNPAKLIKKRIYKKNVKSRNS